MAERSSSPTRPSPPSSPRRTHSHQRSLGHIPATPSRLREAFGLSPTAIHTENDEYNSEADEPSSMQNNLHPSDPHVTTEPNPMRNGSVSGEFVEPDRQDANESTGLLENYQHSRIYGLKGGNNNIFVPRNGSFRSNRSSQDATWGMHYPDSIHEGRARLRPQRMMTESILEGITGHKPLHSTTWMQPSKTNSNLNWYQRAPYYIPFFRWIPQYQWNWFRGDLVAALTMASFYIPMALSLASNLAHVPPINGLYSFVFNPLIYAFLGSCPQMVVGPEAAGSLLVGTVVKSSIDLGYSHDESDAINAQIAGIVTGIAGAIILIAGLARLGFLDSVLSRPFLRGFISAIGFVIFVDQSIPELGLSPIAKEQGISHGSSAQKLVFLVKNIQHFHGLTAVVSLTSFAIIMILRTIKQRLSPRYPSMTFFPDRFLVVVTSAILSWQLRWDLKGLDVLGTVESSGGSAIPFHWPFKPSNIKFINTAINTSFIISLLGFFESSVAAKSLGEGTSGLKHMHISPNRELVALGVANLIGGCFTALPAFGGYGRSKVNAATGGTTPMSSILLSAITLICVLFLLPFFYYLPRGVLSAMISVVAYSLIEEAPHDIKFFLRIRGWVELSLMLIIFLSTVFYSLTMGIAAGMGLSLLAIVRHATKPRIQILGKVPGSNDRFENAELSPDNVEYIENCLIVKIPEPLTFANTGQLKNRLKRLEQFEDAALHPERDRRRSSVYVRNKNVIFDVHGVTSIDGSGTQVITEIVESYVKQGRRVIFCRLPKRNSKVLDSFERAGIIETCGGGRHFVDSVEEALKLSEIEDLEGYFEERAQGQDEAPQV